jgi:hypothetical protein
MANVFAAGTVLWVVSYYESGIGTTPFEQNPPTTPATVTGVGLAALTEGLVVAYRFTGDEIRTQKSTSLAVTAWHDAETVTTDADDNCAPSLAVGRIEDLWIAWHNLAEAIFIQRYANGWLAAVSTTPAITGKHPRLLLTEDRQYVAVWDAALLLYGSTDFYETVELLETFAVDEQAVSFFQDRSGLLHIVGEDGGNSVQWTSADGLTWTDRGTLATSAAVPMAGYTVAGGALFVWGAADTLYAFRLDGPHLATAAGPVAVTDLYPEQVAGIAVDRFDIVWLALQATGGFDIDDVGRFAPDGLYSYDQGEVGAP